MAKTADVLILGSGIAGLSTALKCADTQKVLIVCKEDLLEGSTRYAQGGIASVWSKNDSFEEHTQDTLRAGAGLCNEEVVRNCVKEGPSRVQELIDWGVQFTKTTHDPVEAFDLHREGGHGKRRILHADDLTGKAIIDALAAKVRNHPNIEILEYSIAIDLIINKATSLVLGAFVLDIRTGKVFSAIAPATVLATGGAGKVYLYTSNPDTSTGDGIAMAARVGARITNMEFMQFHPTCLYHPSAKNFLITEALRGEGAVLKTLDGHPFMEKYHPLANLAPRDVVARAIDAEMKKSGSKHVWLDATHLGGDFLKQHFPNITERVLSFGIDITQQSIPVVPACHYTCGGVWVDLDGKTSIDGLYAVGEASSTGLHGANRLASNSLLEAVVYAERVALHIQKNRQTLKKDFDHWVSKMGSPKWDSGKAVPMEEQIDLVAHWIEVRTLMWNYVGIVRSDRRLERAKRRIDLLSSEIKAAYWGHVVTKDLIELRNIVTVADLIVRSAQWRKESRGLHTTIDYPEINDRWFASDTVL